MILYEEEVVVQTRWVARERVRLAVHTVTELREINEDLRSERVEIGEHSRPDPAQTSGTSPHADRGTAPG